jgi:SOS response regulatory protein OraA/RecX
LADKHNKPEIKAFNEALKILAKKDVSSAKLASKLAEKGYERDEIEDVCRALQKKGYLNDAGLAERQARIYLDKGKGFFYIKHHLNNLGLSQAPQVDIQDEVKVILEILRKKGLTPKKLTGSEARVKIMVFLSRRGFRHEAISKAIKNIDETEG